MNDRELLELAAKAGGYSVRWYEDSLAYGPTFGIEVEPGNPLGFEVWNPLTDDGDALRLAAKLRLQILPGKHVGDGCSVNPTSHTTCGVTVFRDSKNMAEQMRYAIVMAAAEIGAKDV